MNIEKMYEKATITDCRLCGRHIYPGELEEAVAIQTKRKEYVIFHRNCICKESGCNKTLTFGEAIFR